MTNIMIKHQVGRGKDMFTSKEPAAQKQKIFRCSIKDTTKSKLFPSNVRSRYRRVDQVAYNSAGSKNDSSGVSSIEEADRMTGG